MKPRLVLPPLPPGTPVNRRAPDLIYGANDKPPLRQLLTLGVQHALAALSLLTYVIAAAAMARLSIAETQAMVAATALALGLCTVLQSWGGRLGPGILLVHIPNPMLMLLVAAVVARFGVGGMVTTTLFASLCALLVSLMLPRLRTLFPPAVAGVVVCMGGITLIGSALEHALQLDEAARPDASAALVAAITLGAVVACSIWGSRNLKLLGLLVGIGLGTVAAALTGHLTGLEAVIEAPLLALPTLPAPVLVTDPGVLLAVLMIVVLSQLDTLASVIIMNRMEDADWRRPNLHAVARSIRANAYGDAAAGLFGAFPSATSSANIALCHISRSTSRQVGLAAGALLVLVGLMPKLTSALTLMPGPVVGAIEVYVSAFLVVAGVELIMQRALDSRGVFMVGLSITFGLAVVVVPTMAGNAPPTIAFMLGNGLVVAGVTAVVLNLLFRLGTSRQAELVLEAGASANAITDFVEIQGKAWNARRDVIARAAQATLEAVEAIAAAGDGRRVLALRGSFDEYNLDIDVMHKGPPMPMTASPRGHDLLAALDEEGDDALDAALASVSLALLRSLADRVNAGTRGEQAFLRLHFDH